MRDVRLILGEKGPFGSGASENAGMNIVRQWQGRPL